MKFDLARLVKGRRRKLITFRPIISTLAQAGDLLAIYSRMLKPWGTAVDKLRPLYERELQRVLTHDAADELTGLTDDLAGQINRLILELSPDLKDWVLRTERWHRGKWARAVQAGVDVGLDTLLGPADVQETLDAFLVRNTSLIRDVNEQTRGRIADAILRGIQQRTPTAKVAKEISEAVGMARKRARRIAAHQSVNLNSALNRQRRRQANLDHWKWRHSHKLHPRLEHVARDGKIYTDENAPQDLPGVLPNCGCVEQAVLVVDGEAL